MGKFFINCDEATKICNKNQYKEATFFEKIKLRFHLLLCKYCKQFSKQNSLVTKACNEHLRQEVPLKTLTPKEKAVMRQKIVNQNK